MGPAPQGVWEAPAWWSDLANDLANDLVDEHRVMIDPIQLSGGERIFHDDSALRSLQLTNSRPTTTGAILATYRTA